MKHQGNLMACLKDTRQITRRGLQRHIMRTAQNKQTKVRTKRVRTARGIRRNPLMIAHTVCILYRHNDLHSHSHIQMEVQNAHSQCEGDLQMNQTPSWNNSASIKEVSAGVGQRSSLHLFLCLHCPSLFFSRDFSFFFFFFRQNSKWKDFRG